MLYNCYKAKCKVHKVSILCNCDSITKATDKYTVREIYFAELIEQSGLL